MYVLYFCIPLISVISKICKILNILRTNELMENSAFGTNLYMYLPTYIHTFALCFDFLISLLKTPGVPWFGYNNDSGLVRLDTALVDVISNPYVKPELSVNEKNLNIHKS